MLIHILDTQSRDIRVEAETSDSREIVYEDVLDTIHSDDDEPKHRSVDRNKRSTELIIHLFGSTPEGKSVRVDVEGFRPSFYIRIPSPAAVDAIRVYLTTQGIPLSILTLKTVQRKPLYGFTGKDLFHFLEITTPSLSIMRQIRSLFLNEQSLPYTKRPLGPPFKKGVYPEIYEANLDPMLRFFHVQKISPCGWIQIEDGMDHVEDAEADTWVLTAHYTDICPAPSALSAPFLLASWDIECYSRTGDFPVANKSWDKIEPCKTAEEALVQFDAGLLGSLRPRKTRAALEARLRTSLTLSKLDDLLTIGDPVIQIGTTLTRNSMTLDRHLFVWPSCDPIDDITVHAYPDESSMINAWFEWIAKTNPDILVGYNVFGFDERYMWHRAEDLGLVSPNSPVHDLTRLRETGQQVKCEEKRLSSSALGDNFMYIWTAQGRLQIDLFNYIKRSASLPSYKLDEVTKHYLSGKLIKGTREGNKLVLELSGAVKDLRPGRALCLLEDTGETLTDKMVVEEVVGNRVVVAWPLREDGEVLEDDELPFANKWVVVKDDVSPKDIFRLHRGSAADRAIVGKYCLQDCDLVIELYRGLEVFNNSMSMANVCCVPIGYIFTRGQGIKAESLMFKACRERNILIPVLPAPKQGSDGEDSYEGAIVLDPVPGFYRQSPIGVADFASLYPSTIESENISHDSLVWTKDYDASGNLITVVFGSDQYDALEGYGYTDIEFDLLRPDPADKRLHPEKIKVGTRICRYAQSLDGSKATLPEIIRGLLAARKAKRKEKAKETDPAKQALLEAEQLAYKLTANSLYGQLGSSTFKVRLQQLAASVTAYGRKQILFAKAVIDRFYGPEAKNPRCAASCEAKVMYGDSVTGDTPLILQKNGKGVWLCRIDELEGSWSTYHDTKEAVDMSGVSVWTERGWTPIRRLIRHRLAPTKKLFRILTHTGVADVTEDHSLVLANGMEAKPMSVAVGTELLHDDKVYLECGKVECDITEAEAFVMGLFVADGSADVYHCPSGNKATWAINKADRGLLEKAARLCPYETKILDTLESSGVYKLVLVGNIIDQAKRYRQLFYNLHREKRVPECILNAPLLVLQAFWDGFYSGDGDKDLRGYIRFDQKGKEISSGLAILAMRLGYKVSITDREDKQDVFRCTMTNGKQRRNPIAIKKIRELPHPGADAFVYDLETDNHHFAVGPGSLIVHNTDSLFVEFNPKDPATGERLTGREARQAVMDLTTEAGKLVTKALKPPHDFEFDKIFDPMLMFSKKRYAGLMYEENVDDYVFKYMGIALKRRDNAPIVKTIFGSAMRSLLLDRDIVAATQGVQTACLNMVQGKVKLGQLTITKSLRAEYADPTRIAHKVLADRIAAREPGSAPASGDRIPYVYVRPEAGSAAAKLQGDRIETPSWIKEKGLTPDYEFYLGHQLQNPISQMFGLLLADMPGSEKVPWASAPTDPRKRLAWNEDQAAVLLFQKAYQLCSNGTKRAFAAKFFGVESGDIIKVTQRKAATTSTTVTMPTTTTTVAKKPAQSTLNSFMFQSYLVHNMEQTQRQQRAALKKKAEEESETSSETKPRTKKPINEIVTR